ncbi:hypothetical protein [Nitrosovibrio tenuis]|uniref:Uncharacterized protein n=1 Tax=Nitrosovibrio tenuis TaxID=1233 RepID=A0A1H7R1L6_9PROT|nr:hypothetical protein [Nitrosovibrio tenuis]SEL54042.1 hypothetical protein SAMN05216387_11446 [Nitrosovibrio tenuis]
MSINPSTGEEHTQEELDIIAAKVAYRNAIDSDAPDAKEIERLMQIHTDMVASHIGSKYKSEETK